MLAFSPIVSTRAPRVIGRYLLCEEVASGGMATVHLGRLMGPEGFSRTVAIKQLHPQFARDPEFTAMFMDEARLASRIRHPNVVSPLDIVVLPPELFIVMDYVNGDTLAHLRKKEPGPLPVRIVSAIMSQALLGLHAAHEATGESGQPLGIVHRDVSPHNIMVSQDGVVRVVDFGIAKASHRSQQTERGKLKGKLGYMAPEQILLQPTDRRADVFAAGVVLWELLSGQRLFAAENPAASVEKILHGEVERLTAYAPDVPAAFEQLVMKALSKSPRDRFSSARELALALDRVVPPASMLEVGAWVERVCGPELALRGTRVANVEGLRFDDITRALPAQVAAAVMKRDVNEGGPLDSVEPTYVPLPEQGAPAEGRRLRAWAWGAALGIFLTSGFVVWKRIAHERALAATIEASRRAPEPVATVAAATELVSELVAVPAADEAEAPEPVREVAAPLVPTARVQVPTPSRSVNISSAKVLPSLDRHGSLPSTLTAPTAACAVPYTVDKSGVKRFKEECF